MCGRFIKMNFGDIGSNEGVQCGKRKTQKRACEHSLTFSLPPTLTCLIQYDKLLLETWHAGRVILP